MFYVPVWVSISFRREHPEQPRERKYIPRKKQFVKMGPFSPCCFTAPFEIMQRDDGKDQNDYWTFQPFEFSKKIKKRITRIAIITRITMSEVIQDWNLVSCRAAIRSVTNERAVFIPRERLVINMALWFVAQSPASLVVTHANERLTVSQGVK